MWVQRLSLLKTILKWIYLAHESTLIGQCLNVDKTWQLIYTDFSFYLWVTLCVICVLGEVEAESEDEDDDDDDCKKGSMDEVCILAISSDACNNRWCLQQSKAAL